jgi:uncharacterized protein (TIGR02231 family)
MKPPKVLIAFIFFTFLCLPAWADAAEIEGKITKAIVYRGQALVTRIIEADLPAGTSEIIVANLPVRIVPDSIYAQAGSDLKVLSVRYREKFVGEDTREEVKKLDLEIENLKREIYHTERRKGHFDNQWEMFIKLRQFVADAKQIDTDRGLLQFEPVKNIAEYILEKADQYIEKILSYEDQLEELKKKLELLAGKRNELTSSSSKTQRQAIIFISSNKSQKASVELNYLVSGADWQQQYNLRANPEKSIVTVEYNAVINQTSGEDWDNVSLSLSTAEPTLVAEAPILAPMSIALFSPQVMLQAGQGGLQLDVQAQVERQTSLRRENARKGIQANQPLNSVAGQIQLFELNADMSQLKSYKQQLAEITRNEGVSVTYNLPGLLTLPSRSDRQLVSIASINAKADFYLLATPILTDYVYLQADLINDSDIVLLPGPASMFRNGEFVGKGTLPLVTIGEKFTAGLGIDSPVQVTQELEDKSTRIQGGNQIDTYNYRIALNNYKNTSVKLRLLDRLPYCGDSSIKVELAKTSLPLSEDAEYLRTLKKKGILRCDLELKPNTTAENATIVTYSFTIEYDKNMKLNALDKI